MEKERMQCTWETIMDHEDEKCDQEGTMTLPGKPSITRSPRMNFTSVPNIMLLSWK
jgi:hypothetical protein